MPDFLWILALLTILVFAVLLYSKWRFKNQFMRDVREFVVRTAAVIPDRLAESDIAHLPDPVKKYLRYTQCLGKPKVRTFKVEFTGQLRASATSPWMPFTSIQYNALDKPTRLFFMKAIMKHLPVAGYHRYREGVAFMDIRLFSLFRVQYQSGKEMGIAETVTFFNDMCCMAPATLIDKRITWVSTEGNTVHAQFTTNDITISARLYFNETGELVDFISDDRFAVQQDGSFKRQRWSTPLKDYREINGRRLASSAEAVYQFRNSDVGSFGKLRTSFQSDVPDAFTYGTFKTTDVDYNCSEVGE